MATIARRYTRFIPFSIFSLLALLILGPLLRGGYILTLDLVFTPKLRMPTTITSSYLLHALFRALNVFLPSQLIEKGMLFAILLLAGTGLYYLVLDLDHSRDRFVYFGALTGGIFYVINPFVYDRLMAGQYNVVFGYALLPWFIGALLRFVTIPSCSSSVAVAIWALVISIVSIHAIGFMLLIIGATLIIYGWHRYHDAIWRIQVLKLGSFALAIFLVMSSYWLVPLMMGKNATALNINGYGANDLTAFATGGNGLLGKAAEILRLQGFWAEHRDLYTLPQSHVALWPLVTVLVLLLVMGGAISYWRNGDRKLVLLFVTSGVFAGILALGTMDTWLVSHVALYAGYREPQKFVAILALSYAVFIARSVKVVLKYCYQQGSTLYLTFAIVLVMLIPAVWTSTMFWAFNEQLVVTQYPADWFSVNRRLDAEHNNFQTLFLPWHLYMFYGFAGRIIANPAPAFFDKSVIVSDNPEFKNASYTNRTPATRQLDLMIPKASSSKHLGGQLAILDIKYVILAKEDDANSYAYLQQQQDLKLVSKSDTLDLYVNEDWRSQ